MEARLRWLLHDLLDVNHIDPPITTNGLGYLDRLLTQPGTDLQDALAATGLKRLGEGAGRVRQGEDPPQ